MSWRAKLADLKAEWDIIGIRAEIDIDAKGLTIWAASEADRLLAKHELEQAGFTVLWSRVAGGTTFHIPKERL